ncbi:MAG TPA: OmpA family protein [Kofleriaceae bacterium]
MFCAVSGAACPGTSGGPTTMAAGTTLAPAAPMDDAAADSVRVAVPWSLTASDGSGLALRRIDARAVVEGPLAFTELHLYFRNDESRIREGTFQIALPERAAVSRFAMADAGQWMEAEVVPRLVARRAYDDFLHRRQDPALLEKAAGNQFTAKVFPIAANAEKELVISYSQDLPGIPYVLPLRGLPRVERVEVEVAYTGPGGTRTTERLAERDWEPDRDLVVATGMRAASATAIGAGGLIAAQIELAGTTGRDVPRGVALLVDTSASRALGFERYVASLRTLVAELRAAWGAELPLTVVAFDQDTELMFEGRAADFDEASARELSERGAAGASDLGQVLSWLAARRGVARSRAVVVTDGVITAGVEGHALQAAVQQLSAVGVERLDVVLAGGLRDERTASLLARAGLPRAGAVLDLDRDRVAIALGEPVWTDVPISVTGATWVYPRRVASARSGAHVLVLARLATPAAFVDITAGGAPARIAVQPGPAPLVERAVAGAELAELTETLATATGKEATALRAAIESKSVAARVLSSETSMLVLGSDADDARYGIDRKALTDVLVVGPRGIERMHRGDVGPIPARAPSSRHRDDPNDRDGRGDRSAVSASDAVRDDAAARDGDGALDVDHDGIPDDEDGCPDDPESRNGFADGDGCPDRGRVIVTSASIEILDNVYFQPDRATIAPGSLPVLDAVAQVLLHNPDIAAVEVQGHTDERGDDRHNLELSGQRADAVKQYLVAKGVAEQRLIAQGYGETQPLDRRHSEAAWAKNRRVAFLITRRDAEAAPAQTRPAGPPEPPAAVTGELAAIEAALGAGDVDAAVAKARDWRAREPGNVLALIGLGEALEARHAEASAARAYGSIIDLFPGRADMRRFAGERLSRLTRANALAVDTYRRAVADRPDHLTGHRLLAYALVRAGKPDEAFAATLAALARPYRSSSHAGGLRVLGDDASVIGAVYAKAVPAKRAEIAAALAAHHLQIASAPSTRFILYWETDGNDVDLHVQDARGGHAWYSQPRLASGGELYADVTTGYGPECFTIAGAPAAGPYRLWVDYYAQGPMGYGMGLVEIQTFDPARGVSFDDRPFVIMNNHAKVDLGTYR